MEYKQSDWFNFGGIKNTAANVDVRSDEALRKFLVEVGINEGVAYEIDQFFHNDIPSSKLSMQQQEWVMSYYDIISGYLLASTTNKISGRRYDWTPLILKAYERAKSLVVVSKADQGWMTLNVLKRELVQRQMLDERSKVVNRNEKGGWFDKKDSGDYGTFEK